MIIMMIVVFLLQYNTILRYIMMTTGNFPRSVLLLRGRVLLCLHSTHINPTPTKDTPINR